MGVKKSRLFEPVSSTNYLGTCSPSQRIDFSPMSYFSAFLVAALIFLFLFASRQKENRVQQLQKSSFNKNLRCL